MNQFCKKTPKKTDMKAEYDALSSAFEMKRQMISMRKEAGFTQEQMAKLLGTRKSNISGLESISTDSSPRLATIEHYARALGYSMKNGFEARANQQFVDLHSKVTQSSDIR